MTAMRDQLSAFLTTLDPVQLTAENIAQLERAHGIYELLHRDGTGQLQVVYVGKAQGDPLPERLADHLLKISGRQNIDVADMFFKCAYLEQDLDAVAPETVLIGHRRSGGDAPWNGKIGFGPHDPGKKRDEQEPAPFDVAYPIRDDQVVDFPPGEYDLLDYLWNLKARLPFLLRFQRVDRTWRSGHPDYVNRKVTVPEGPVTALELLALPAEVLPPAWRMTVLPGYAVLYRDRPRSPVVRSEFEGKAPEDPPTA